MPHTVEFRIRTGIANTTFLDDDDDGFNLKKKELRRPMG